LDRILSSEVFAHSERMSRFLRFIVQQVLEGREEELKESVVGVEVYDRPADYNPKEDPIVRNDARRLRAKLREYYATDGQDEVIVIDLPKGTYIPAFRELALPGTRENKSANVPAPWLPVSWKVTSGFCAVLLLGIGAFVGRPHAVAIGSQAPAPSAGGTANLEA